jgi:hypothetical protein
VALSFLHPDGSAVEPLTSARAPASPRAPVPERRFRLADYPATRRCLADRVAVPVYLEGGDPAERRLMAGLGYGALLMVPVISRGRSIGLLQCYEHQLTAWSRRAIRSARLLAAMLGPVLDGLLPQPPGEIRGA